MVKSVESQGRRLLVLVLQHHPCMHDPAFRRACLIIIQNKARQRTNAIIKTMQTTVPRGVRAKVVTTVADAR